MNVIITMITNCGPEMLHYIIILWERQSKKQIIVKRIMAVLDIHVQRVSEAHACDTRH
jgi:hypothetical protein